MRRTTVYHFVNAAPPESPRGRSRRDRIHTCRCVAACAIALLLAGCGGEEPVEVEPAMRVRLVSAGTESKVWEDQGAEVLSRLETDFGAEVGTVEARSTQERRQTLTGLGGNGVDLVLCAGPGFRRALVAEASKHPSTAYLVEGGPVVPPNVSSLQFLVGGAAYVGGVAAVLMSDAPVGVLAGGGGPWLETIEAGFVDGVRSRAPDDNLVEAVGVEGVDELEEAGVEVALYAATRAEADVMEAAERCGLRLITVGSQTAAWDSGTTVAVIAVDLPEAVARISRDVLDGTFVARTYAFDLGSGVVGLKMRPEVLEELGPEGRLNLEGARAAVTAGVVELEQMGL